MPAQIVPVSNKTKSEDERLRILESYQILHSASEKVYDDITALASKLCGTKISLISLVSSDYQWFKSKNGIDVDSTPRNLSFCDHAMREPGDIFEIPDSRLDPRFKDNPLVNAAPNVVFYASMPLTSTDGYGLGALCVIDDKPRNLTEDQKEILRVLGRQVMTQMELRRKVFELDSNRTTLQEMNQELERFADVAAHDLRSPLRAMGSFAGLLRRRLKDRLTSDEMEMFDHIRNGASRLSAMVEGILSVAKAHHEDYSKHSNIDLPTLTAEIADLIDPDQHFFIEFDGEKKRIRASLPAVKQVLMNLMSNAVKYHDKSKGRVIVSCREQEDKICLSVSDDGPGIAQDDQERIWEAFETGEEAPRVPSTGLGLALVRRVVDRMNGKIELHSKLGEGCRFDLFIPRN